MLAKIATKAIMLRKTINKPEIPVLKVNNSAKNIRKKENHKKLKEKRREESFVKRYVELMYPSLYMEIKESYAIFAKKYPSRCDLTKTYFFKKWEKSINPKRSAIFVPHLPILTNQNQLKNLQLKENPSPRQENNIENPSPPQEINIEDPSPQEINIEDPSPPQENNIKNPSPPQENNIENPSPPQELDMAVPQPWQDLNIEIQPPLDQSIMTLDQMAIAAEEIIKTLQSDRNLMDIVENYDFPEATWNNDMVLPDYVLETDADW